MNDEIVLTSRIIHDEYTAVAHEMFDLPLAALNRTVIKNNIELPETWNIGLIHGSSGSGKTTILKQFGNLKKSAWDDRPIISNLNRVEPRVASEVLWGVGLSSVPSWLRPYSRLSAGEQFRADIARAIIDSNDELILIDEYTSFVDRNVAKSLSHALQKYLRRNNSKIILATCHEDIIPWLNPDWLYNPIEGATRHPRGCLQRPPVKLEICRVKYEAWERFKHHHYLTQQLNKAAKCYGVYADNQMVAFTAILPFPHPHLKNAWRESRTVVLPEFQGLGIGVRLGDYFGSLIKAQGGRYYSKTIHPALIAYRNSKKDLWRGFFKSLNDVPSDKSKMGEWDRTKRRCKSFEYIGPAASFEDSKLFYS